MRQLDTYHQTVWVVDDDLASSEALCSHLSFRGFQAKSIRSGVDALQSLSNLPKDQRPSAILLDVLMPGMNGCEVLTELRGHPDTKEIPVMMLSVLSKDEIQEQLACPCQGADAYVCKPFNIERLVNELKGMLNV